MARHGNRHETTGGEVLINDLPITVRHATAADALPWLQLRCALWPETSEADHRDDIDRFFAGRAREPHTALLAQDTEGRSVGLAELSIRPYAQGCRSDRVAYREGWYVVPENRRRGVGRALLVAAEEWARTRGCRELASDTQPDNSASIAAHRALGFSEARLVLCFCKSL